MQSFFPKLTLVAEVDDPEAFGKGLDTLMIAINNELESQATGNRGGGTQGRRRIGKGGRRGPRAPDVRAKGGERTKPRRILTPRFNPIPGQDKSFVLHDSERFQAAIRSVEFSPDDSARGKVRWLFGFL